MRRFILILFFGLLAAQGLAQLDSCRELFFSEQSEESCEFIIAKAKAKATESPILKAYTGASTASLAEFGFNPAKKLTLFNSGKNMIEEAVSLDPKNAEIRLLRMVIQLESPSFLNYNNKIEEDKNIVLEWISGNEAPEGIFLSQIKNYLTSKKISN